MKLLLSLFLLTASFSQAASTINADHRFAWGANVGWLDWRPTATGGANLGMYVCSGYLYAANVGWIQLGDGSPANGIRYVNSSAGAGDFGVNHDPLGNLSGYAYGANVGWLNFGNNYPPTTPRPRINLLTGQVSGWVYGANIGWISLSNAVSYIQTDSLERGPDTDGDGLADPWERQFAPTLAAMNASSDSDGDGATDLDEYRADTNPMDADDRLRITRLERQAGQADLSWRSRPTRFYQIQTRAALSPASFWMNSTLGLQTPDTGITTRRIVPLAAGTEGYFRIEAICPLNP